MSRYIGPVDMVASRKYDRKPGKVVITIPVT